MATGRPVPPSEPLNRTRSATEPANPKPPRTRQIVAYRPNARPPRNRREERQAWTCEQGQHHDDGEKPPAAAPLGPRTMDQSEGQAGYACQDEDGDRPRPGELGVVADQPHPDAGGCTPGDAEHKPAPCCSKHHHATGRHAGRRPAATTEPTVVRHIADFTTQFMVSP